jgi:hypothetical protein
MGKSTMRALVSCLVLLSCTSPAETEQTDAIETTADPGRLALIDSSGDIVVIHPAHMVTRRLDTGLGAGDPRRFRRRHRAARDG